MATSPSQAATARENPVRDRRRVVVFVLALVAFYGGAVLVLRPGPGDLGRIAVPVMFAPAVGALAAVLLAGGRVRLGRPTRHLLLAFLPPAVVLAVTWVLAAVSGVEVRPGVLGSLLVLTPVLALSGSLTAVGEEVGWRGFLWPLLRRHRGFWLSAAVIVPVWWVYHLPAVLWWGYGFVGGLPAFTVATSGFVLFVGVLTERSHGVWAGVLAHGAWNGTVATGFAASLGSAVPECATSGCPPFRGDAQLFTGPQTVLGEFGWVAAATMLVLGVLTAQWHLRHPAASDPHLVRS
ncbi:CPBP family intramembrane metalloprotease [Phycicoccus sp. CSK15P-2]|uniref:CPBP family intramembrane glutamic endopeptidase n=1 Tax=Phycicoccus sp. CSK15P-2 TaxID=2807627 RepID=UPI00194EEF66|nr:CPBP family intramembrane glutamic endopeptidase [Phycicoccus sp. CSK15P-2]MBM6404883.1 CPBP family intramembrane metalloprotease [Phycicoccus sp. CSK15P-2]